MFRPAFDDMVCLCFFSGFHPVWLVFLRTLDQVCINKDRQVNSLAELSKEILDYSNKQDDQMKNKVRRGERSRWVKGYTDVLN